MRRRNRELNIFSMSALDLFASALGAFILITLILMPFYKKAAASNPADQDCPDSKVVKVPVAMDKLLMIQMLWDKKVDVDLHVVTPDGEYFFDNPQIQGKPGQLFSDDPFGGSEERPAQEGWLSFDPTPGTYKVYYKYYDSKDEGEVNVWGKLLKPSGPVILPTVTLQKNKEKMDVLTFKLDNDFKVKNLKILN